MDTRSDAGTLLQSILKFYFLVLLHFWNKILEKLDRVSKTLKMQHPVWKCWKIISKNFVIICAKMQLSIATADVWNGEMKLRGESGDGE